MVDAMGALQPDLERQARLKEAKDAIQQAALDMGILDQAASGATPKPAFEVC